MIDQIEPREETWYDNIMRMEVGWLPKALINYKPRGRRDWGKPLSVCFSLYLSLSVYLSWCLSLFVSLTLSSCFSLSLCLCHSLRLYIFFSFSLCRDVSVCLQHSVCVCVCVCVCFFLELYWVTCSITICNTTCFFFLSSNVLQLVNTIFIFIL